MRVKQITNSRQRITFANTYESAMFLGRTNENELVTKGFVIV